MVQKKELRTENILSFEDLNKNSTAELAQFSAIQRNLAEPPRFLAELAKPPRSSYIR